MTIWIGIVSVFRVQCPSQECWARDFCRKSMNLPRSFPSAWLQAAGPAEAENELGTFERWAATVMTAVVTQVADGSLVLLAMGILRAILVACLSSSTIFIPSLHWNDNRVQLSMAAPVKLRSSTGARGGMTGFEEKLKQLAKWLDDHHRLPWEKSHQTVPGHRWDLGTTANLSMEDDFHSKKKKRTCFSTFLPQASPLDCFCLASFHVFWKRWLWSHVSCDCHCFHA